MNILPSRGRPGVTLLMTIKRSLTHDDLLRRAMTGGPKLGIPTIQRLRTVHHKAARLIAGGMSLKEVAFETNRTPQRISDLLRDPAFQQLVSYYEIQISETTLDREKQIREEVVDQAELASHEIIRRLEDPDMIAKIPIDTLRQIQEGALDRTILPKRQSQPPMQAPVQVTLNMGIRDITPKEKLIEHTEETPLEPIE